MAGIGFELNKLARRDDLMGIAGAYLHSAFAIAGPWLFTVVALACTTILYGASGSDEMMNFARERFPKVNFIKADVLDADTVIGKANQFDAVFFNACFGNIFDQKLALKKTHDLLRSGGSIVISHPLGKRFVKALHDSDPEIVPHFLPEKDQLTEWAKELGMELVEFIDEPDFYLARLA